MVGDLKAHCMTDWLGRQTVVVAGIDGRARPEALEGFANALVTIADHEGVNFLELTFQSCRANIGLYFISAAAFIHATLIHLPTSSHLDQSV